MPMFYMMVGIPGCGKSTAAGSITDAIVHSSDAIRAEILNDVNDQTQQELVFNTLHERVLENLMAGKNVVYDATNIHYKNRVSFLNRVKSLHIHNLKTVCLFVATPYETCLRNNKERERCIPDDVILRMYHSFDVPMMLEGWDEIRIINDENRIDQLDAMMTRLSRLEHDNPFHKYSVGQHSIAAYQYLITHYKDYDTSLSRAVLLHDIGKEDTKVFQDAKGNPSKTARYFGHDRVGAYNSFCYTSDLETKQRLTVALLIRWHMCPYVVRRSQNPDKTANKIQRILGYDVWKQIMVLHDCDRHAH